MILGKKFDVVYTKAMDKDDYGETISMERVIRINIQKAEWTWRPTLVHEMVHAILGVTGHTELLDEKTEEALAIALEHGFEDYVEFDV
jgi:Zn-dependent peptidase ImmA (M78 family)